jgi:hypothetical protein
MCASGTHPELRQIAYWLTRYMPPDECEGLALRWLRHAAQKCDRIPDDGELRRLISWGAAKSGRPYDEGQEAYLSGTPVINTNHLHEIISGPTREELREMSPVRDWDDKERQTATLLDRWAGYAGVADPWVCHGADDRFWTRRLSGMQQGAHCHAQVVPSPMRSQYGRTIEGHLSEHSLDGTGPRLFLVVEFDFAMVNAAHKPTIWAPLIKGCEEKGRSILDMNAALTARLMPSAPLWLVVYSGGKSLQSWWACRETDEGTLKRWFHTQALALGACHSTWCRSQFVRMPDGQRDDGHRQTVEYYNPDVLGGTGANFSTPKEYVHPN